MLKPAARDGYLNMMATDSLAEFGPAAVSAIPALIELLRHGPIPAQSSAAKALGRIAPATPQEDAALAALMERLRADPYLLGITEVIEAIARFGPRAAPALPRLEKLAQSPEATVRDAAKSAMAALKVNP